MNDISAQKGLMQGAAATVYSVTASAPSSPPNASIRLPPLTPSPSYQMSVLTLTDSDKHCKFSKS